MEQETKQEAYLNFETRWKNLRQVSYGENEVLAMLELPEQFSDDLDNFTLHPALMDLATSAGLPLVDGYETSTDFYVPLSYKRVQVHGRCRAAFTATCATTGTAVITRKCLLLT